MFLVTNEQMIIEALRAGVTAAIPALNYRTTEELRSGIRSIKKQHPGKFGINLIVNNSNPLYKQQLEVCCAEGVGFIITSLGSPLETIEMAHKHGILVFCDVTDLAYALKVEALGADAVIAVNNRAGGHAGTMAEEDLIPLITSRCKIPVISAGGIGKGEHIRRVLERGAEAVSVGSIFIATAESPVSDAYKEACVHYGATDIVMTTKLSGTPCTVIKTPYVNEIGTEQNWIEKVISRNRRLKKWIKMFTFLKGIKQLNRAAFTNTYKTIWCAGPAIEHVRAIEPLGSIVRRLVAEYEASKKDDN